MLLKKAAILGASLLLTCGVASNSLAATTYHYHYHTTHCHNGVCHSHVKNVYKTCGKGGCKHWHTHYRYHWKK